MKPRIKWVLFVMTTAGLVTLSSCGGGGGGGEAPSTGTPATGRPATPAANSALTSPIKGTVAVGAPIANASIELFDPTSSLMTRATSTADGSFQIESDRINFPALLRASGGTVNGSVNSEIFHLVLASKISVANLTPVSEMYTARLLRQLPAQLFGNANGASTALNGVSDSAGKQAQDDVVAILHEEGISVDTAQIPNLVSSAFNARADDAFDELLSQIKTAGINTAAIATELARTGNTIPAASAAILALQAEFPSDPSYSGTVKITLSAADRNGLFFKGLSSDKFSLQPFSVTCSSGNSQAITGSFGASSVVENSGTGKHDYSAMVLLDQSGSISSSDPKNARIDGSKALFAAASAADEIGLGYFSGEGNEGKYARYLPLFGQTLAGLNSNLDFLANKVAGGTPLYTSVVSAANDVAINATKPSKALVIFSDGDSNSETATASDAIANANTKGIKLYSVVLNSGGNSINKLDEFISLGTQTGGAMFVASDVRRSLGAYNSMSAFLDGTASSYTVSTVVTGNNPCGPGQVTLPSGVTVATKAGELSVPIVLTFK